MEELLSDSHVWYAISFTMFAVFMWRYVFPVLIQFLDARIAQIIRDLEEAENLRIEAQEMLAQYQRKHQNALQESQKILEKARENVLQYKEKAQVELDAAMKRREEQMDERLERMEQNAIAEIQAHAADLAMNAAKQIIDKQLNKKINAKLVDSAIKNVVNNIH